MKLVFLDTEKRHAFLFQETGMTAISFDKIYTLKSILKNEPVIYVSDAVVTNSSEIIELVNSLKENTYTQDNYSNLELEQNPQQDFSNPDFSNPANWNSSEEPLYIHPTSNKRILIPDMGGLDHNGQIAGFTFQGYLDFQSLKYLSTAGFNDSNLIHSLIANGTLEVVPHSQVQVLKASYVPTQSYNKKEYAQKYKRYSQYNQHKNIIVDDKVGGGGGSTDMDIATPMGDGSFKGDDIIPIEIGSGASFKTGGSGTYGNEGRLVE